MEGILEVSDSKGFDSLLEKVSGRLLVVHFAAPWAPQCQQMNEVMQELMKDATLSGVAFAKLDAENIPEVSQKFQIAAVPTFIFFKNKRKVDRLDGANAAELTKKVRALAAGGPAPAPAPAANPTVPKEDLNTKLKKLINKAPIMLFMKGSPDEPRCGFSKQTVQLLKDHNIEYSSFDILTDEEVRQGLKTYSDWPTYPQLYSGGELVGGLDILKEMAEAGELASLQAQAEKALEDRLKGLINQSPVMLFMKGSPEAPRCGFSKTTVSILNETGVKYDTFDILSDESVRQGLKKLSNWPTYPQLYVKGQLVGGLDIIKEMKEAGELEAALKV